MRSATSEAVVFPSSSSPEMTVRTTPEYPDKKKKQEEDKDADGWMTLCPPGDEDDDDDRVIVRLPTGGCSKTGHPLRSTQNPDLNPDSRDRIQFPFVATRRPSPPPPGPSTSTTIGPFSRSHSFDEGHFKVTVDFENDRRTSGLPLPHPEPSNSGPSWSSPPTLPGPWVEVSTDPQRSGTPRPHHPPLSSLGDLQTRLTSALDHDLVVVSSLTVNIALTVGIGCLTVVLISVSIYAFVRCASQRNEQSYCKSDPSSKYAYEACETRPATPSERARITPTPATPSELRENAKKFVIEWYV